MAKFTKEYFNSIGNWEGGYQCDPVDTGNYDSKKRLIGTCRGCAAITVETYYKRFKNIDLSKRSSETFILIMKNLTYDEAFDIGKRLFWDSLNLDLCNNQSIAESIFDWYWASFAYGIQWMQGALSVLLHIPFRIDFRLDKSEIELINNFPYQKLLFDSIKSERLKYVDWLCIHDPKKLKYIKGWKRRINAETFEP